MIITRVLIVSNIYSIWVITIYIIIVDKFFFFLFVKHSAIELGFYFWGSGLHLLDMIWIFRCPFCKSVNSSAHDIFGGVGCLTQSSFGELFKSFDGESSLMSFSTVSAKCMSRNCNKSIIIIIENILFMHKGVNGLNFDRLKPII